MRVFALLDVLTKPGGAPANGDGDDDAAVLDALRNAKAHPESNPVASNIALLVKHTATPLTAASVSELVEFLFSNLTTRSHERLMMIVVSCASICGDQFMGQLKGKVENSMKDSNRLDTLFGLGALFVIEKLGADSSASKEYYHFWLSKQIAASSRRIQQFLLALFETTFSKSPSDFNCSTVLSIRNHAIFKQLLSEIKSHLSEAKDIEERKLVELGVLSATTDKRKTNFDALMKDFVSTGNVPKSLFMEMLINDSWYKTQFLPRLVKRVDGDSDQQWKHQQALFNLLQKSGRVPSSFLTSRANAIIESIQTIGEIPLSLQDLDTLQLRMTNALDVLVQLEETADHAIEKDCLESIYSLFKQINRLFKTPALYLNGVRFSVDDFGTLESYQLFCNSATIAVVDTFLQSCTKFTQFTMAVDNRLGEIIHGFVLHLPTTIPTLVLRISSLLYGSAELSRTLSILLSRIVYHVCVWLPASLYTNSLKSAVAELAPDDDDKTPIPSASSPDSFFLIFFKKYTRVSCPPHMDAVVDTIVKFIETRHWSFLNQEEGPLARKRDIDAKESAFLNSILENPLLPSLVRRREWVTSRQKWISDSVKVIPLAVGMSLYDWVLWEVSCPASVDVFRRARYVQRNFSVLLEMSSRLACALADVLRGICDALKLSNETQQPGLEISASATRETEGLLAVCSTVSKLLAVDPMREWTEADVTTVFSFVDTAANFQSVFNVVGLLPLWILQSSKGVDDASMRFWEAKFVELESAVSWSVLSDASILLFQGALEWRKSLESAVVVLERFMSCCPTVAAFLLASPSSDWYEGILEILQLMPEGIVGLLKTDRILAPFRNYPELISKSIVINAVSNGSNIQGKPLDDDVISSRMIVSAATTLLNNLNEYSNIGVWDPQTEAIVAGYVEKLVVLALVEKE
ncbi:hypothetical protein BDR26DRAFT_871547 [Obelidium mucronatum]|nr:hypothetical protein BDR26DRAFT_871547 [Obelidium mucronatum]